MPNLKLLALRIDPSSFQNKDSVFDPGVVFIVIWSDGCQMVSLSTKIKLIRNPSDEIISDEIRARQS